MNFIFRIFSLVHNFFCNLFTKILNPNRRDKIIEEQTQHVLVPLRDSSASNDRRFIGTEVQPDKTLTSDRALTTEERQRLAEIWTKKFDKQSGTKKTPIKNTPKKLTDKEEKRHQQILKDWLN